MTFSIAAIMESQSIGLKYKAASPAISLKVSILLKTTGHSQEKASKIGIPKPSLNDGKTKAKACL